MPDVTVIGGGLAGVECCHQLLNAGLSVRLVEAKPESASVYELDTLAELVCSNSLKSELPTTASGLLKQEMRLLGSFLLGIADETRVPAGSALAVDRVKFSALATKRLTARKGLTLERRPAESVPGDTPYTVIATGPLTCGKLAKILGADLHFYDATAPIVSDDSINRAIAFPAARYDKGGADYLNCPFSKEEYEQFLSSLLGADTVRQDDYDDRLFSDCQPVERLAARGPDTLRFGTLRPVGLKDPRTGKRPYAVVQLRREDLDGQMWGLVGFQTRLKFSEQERVFRMIPGLEDAEFYRFGVMHRNTYLNGPKTLLTGNRLKSDPRVFVAGQLTGVEGYMESAASGLLVGRYLAALMQGIEPGSVLPPPVTMSGALFSYVTTSVSADYQPMNANFGLLPKENDAPRKKAERYARLAGRALEAIGAIV